LELAGGSHELAVILNQMAYLDRWLTMSSIKKYALSDKCGRTIRKKLNMLLFRGLIERETNNQLYGAHTYRAKDDLNTYDERLLVAMIEGRDMQQTSSYTEAELLNKFRTMVMSNSDQFTLSSRELRELIRSDRCTESIRLIIRRLERQGYLKSRLIGRVYEYELDRDRLLDTRSPEIVEEQGNYLAKLHAEHVRHFLKKEVTEKSIKSWRLTYKRMLLSGYSFGALKHIIAYLPQDKMAHVFDTPSAIKRRYVELYESAYRSLSVRKANRHIYKLLNGLFGLKTKTVEKDNATVAEEDVWAKVEKWFERLRKILNNWYRESLFGVDDIDYEDYQQHAKLLMHGYITAPPAARASKDQPDNWLHYRLNDYMYQHRYVDKNKDCADEDKHKQLLVTHIDYLGNMGSAPLSSANEEEGRTYAAEAVNEALKQLPERERNMVRDYYGFDGQKYTLEEVTEKYGYKAASWVHTLIKRAEERLKEILYPKLYPPSPP
jgi:DNA-directed RNA polymerase specialized sigma24 family protein